MKKLFLIIIFSFSMLLAENKCDIVFKNAKSTNSASFKNFPYGQNVIKMGSFVIYQNGYRKYFLETIDKKPLLDTRAKIDIKKYDNQYYVFVDFIPYIFSEPTIFQLKNNNLELLCSFKYIASPYCLDCKNNKLEKYIKTEYKNLFTSNNNIKIDFDNDGQVDILEYIDDISGGKCDYLSYKILNKNNTEITKYIFEKYNILINKCFKKIGVFSFDSKNYIYVENDDFSLSIYLIEDDTIKSKNSFKSNVSIAKTKE